MFEQLLAENKDTYVIEDVAFKPNCQVPMIDNSAKLVIAKKLALKGKKVIIKDNPAVILEVRKGFGSMFQYEEK